MRFGNARVLPAPPGLPRLSDREFEALREFIYKQAGIHLSPAKKALLVGRLARRLRALGLASFAEYCARVRVDAAERIEMLDAICTNETRFFRESKQFEFLASTVYPSWRTAAALGARPGSLRAWSAACSSGEEPYSIAMSLLEHFTGDGWSIEVLGTDLSTRVLARAEAATWPIAKAAEIPEGLRRRFMLRGHGSQEGLMKAGPALRSVVRFGRMNLHVEPYPVSGPFDLIFCRNVLIYFSRESKAAVVERLLSRLAPGGLLLLGLAESLSGLTDRVRSVGPTVYALRG
jgi:chemotaxis protein methyltransferase CheR